MSWFRRKKPNRKLESGTRDWRRLFYFGSGLLLLAALGVSGWQAFLRAGYEEFRALEVSGPMENVSASDIQRALQDHLAKGFLDFNIAAARDDVVALPWVKDASLRRGWPGVLHVQIEEQRPVATWFGTALLNAEGEIFVDGAVGYSGVLPDLAGPSGMQQDLLARMQQLQDQLSGNQLELRRLYLTERRAERIWLDNGIEVRLGRRDYASRLDRFMDVAWPALHSRATAVSYIDMRYTNGFAVGWKQENSNDARTASGEASDVQKSG